MRYEHLGEMKHLEDKLNSTRQTLLMLLPEDLHSILYKMVSAESTSEFDQSANDAVEDIIDMAVAIDADDYPNRRAYCPLCNRGAMVKYRKDFALPEGLRRHLTGWGTNRQCEVYEAAYQWAISTNVRRFAEHERASEQAKRSQNDLRRMTENVYLTDPTLPPQLLEEGVYQPRSAEGLAEAEKRLTEMNFKVAQRENIKAFVRTIDDYAVFADPREQREIKFRVFNNTDEKKRRRTADHYESFSIPDRFKHKLLEKFDKLFEEAIKHFGDL